MKVPVDDAEDVRRILDDFAERGQPATRIALHKPTLDEVFLALT